MRAPLLALSLLVYMPAHAGDDDSLTLFGLVRPTFTLSDGLLGSYGRPHAVAPNMAGAPSLVAEPDRLRGGWQTSQTRFGAKATTGPVTGVIELDFIDFRQASGTTGLRPRLRIASVAYTANDTTLTVGQTWDAFSPGNPLHNNFVGGHFLSGNQGFMRNQVILKQQIGGGSITGALGMAGANGGLTDGPLEQSPIPTGTLRAVTPLADNLEVAAAGFVGSIPRGDDPLLAWGSNGFVSWKPGKDTKVVAEGYVGQNLGNAGMLTLAVGNPNWDGLEAGGWISTRHGIDRFAFTVTVGGASLLNGEKAPAGYVISEETGLGTWTGGGIRHNVHERVGFEYKPVKNLALYTEAFALQTGFVRADGDPNEWDANQARIGVDFGAVYRFKTKLQRNCEPCGSGANPR